MKLDDKEGWAPKNRCFQIVVLEETHEILLGQQGEPVNSNGNQPWIFVGRTDTETEAPILWPLVAKSWLNNKKILMLGKIEGKRRRGWKRMGWLGSTTDSMDMSLSKLWEMLKDREAWHAAVHWVTKSWHSLAANQHLCYPVIRT